MQYYSDLKRKEILPFVTTHMSLEGIMLSKINQTKTKCMVSLTGRSRRKESPISRDRVEKCLLGAGGWGVGEKERLVKGYKLSILE